MLNMHTAMFTIPNLCLNLIQDNLSLILLHTWASIPVSQGIINKAAYQWRKWLHACKKSEWTSRLTSDKLKHLFSEPPTVYHKKHVTLHIISVTVKKEMKYAKVKAQGSLICALFLKMFRQCLLKIIIISQNYSWLAKVGAFLRHMKELFRELKMLEFNCLANLYDNLERTYSQKNDFDLLTSWVKVIQNLIDLSRIISNHSTKCHKNLIRSFWIILLTDRQTDRQTGENNLLGRGNNKFPSVLWHCWLSDKKGIWPVENWVLVFVGDNVTT